MDFVMPMSNQICQKLNGGMHLGSDGKGRQVYSFNMRCINARYVLNTEDLSTLPLISDKNQSTTANKNLSTVDM